MRRYLIVSDAHGDREILVKLAQRYQQDVVAMFYLGDSELAADDPLFRQFEAVAGNMDFDHNFLAERFYADPFVKIFSAHGHLYQTPQTLQPLLAAGKKREADVILTGHTHQLGAQRLDDMIVINPGSISQPRGQYAYLTGTYAILSLDAATAHVQFYTRDGWAVPELAVSFKHEN